MAYFLDLFVLFAVLITESLCGEICDFYSGSTKKFMYCGVSCCGSIYDRKCCEETPIGLYIGIIAGTIVCIILIIIIVICCVYQGKQKTTIRRHRTPQGGPDMDDFNMMRVLRAPPKPPEYTQDAPPAYDAQFSPFSLPEQNYANSPPLLLRFLLTLPLSLLLTLLPNPLLIPESTMQVLNLIRQLKKWVYILKPVISQVYIFIE